MNKAKWLGCVVLVLCLFTSCPQDVGRVTFTLFNDTSSFYISGMDSINKFENGIEVVSDELLKSAILAGESREFTVPLRELGDGDAIRVITSNSVYIKSVGGKYEKGMIVTITFANSGQGGAVVNVEVIRP